LLARFNDVGRWKVKYGAEIVGYVQDVKPGRIESVNCHAGRDRDTHIELVLNPMNTSAQASCDCGSHTAIEGDHGLAGS
jgi:hypothetical protein